MHMVGPGPTLSRLVWIDPWGSWAWTLQEALLSPRCIYTSRYQVQLECNATTCFESFDEPSFIHQIRWGRTFFGQENWHQKNYPGILRPPFTSNMGLENGWTETVLDVCDAVLLTLAHRTLGRPVCISGIIQTLETFVHKSSFHWGLSLDDLNRALVWDGRNRARKRQGYPT